MGTDVRKISSDQFPRVAAVSVGVLWGRRHDPQPELLPVTEIGIAMVEDGEIADRFYIVSEDLKRSTDILLELDAPLLTFNGPRFDWLALGSLINVDALIPRTIDIYSALLPCVEDIVEAEGTTAFPTSRDDYGVLNPTRLAETNLGHVPGSEGDAIGNAELTAELWLHLLRYERALIAGRAHALPEDSLVHLRGGRPSFDSAQEWHKMVADRPDPQPYRRRKRHQITFPRIDQRYV
jgi:hypothetical protein